MSDDTKKLICGLPAQGDPRDIAATFTALLVLIGSMISTYGRGEEVHEFFSKSLAKLIEQTQDSRLAAALTKLELTLRQLIEAAEQPLEGWRDVD